MLDAELQSAYLLDWPADDGPPLTHPGSGRYGALHSEVKEEVPAAGGYWGT